MHNYSPGNSPLFRKRSLLTILYTVCSICNVQDNIGINTYSALDRTQQMNTEGYNENYLGHKKIKN